MPNKDSSILYLQISFEAPHVKTNKMTVHPAKTQISLGIHSVWSEFSLCTQWVAKDPSFLHADSEDSDQTGRMPRLIWVFAGRTVIILVLSWGSSYNFVIYWVSFLFLYCFLFDVEIPEIPDLNAHSAMQTVLCIIWSGSTLFAKFLLEGAGHKWIKVWGSCETFV